MKTAALTLMLAAGMIPNLFFAQEQDPLAEHVAFHLSFDGSLDPDQSRGSNQIIVGNHDKSRYEFIRGIRGKAVLGKKNVQSLRFKIKDNVDFAKPGSVAFWFNPVNWAVQTPDTPNQGKTQWKQTKTCGFFASTYHSSGYIVLQRQTSHVPGNTKDVLMLVFPCFKNITKSNVRTQLEFGRETWHHMAMTWDGLKYIVYVDGREVLSTLVPYKISSDKLGDCFVIVMNEGLAYDEFTIYDRQLSAAEVAGLFQKDNPLKK